MVAVPGHGSEEPPDLTPLLGTPLAASGSLSSRSSAATPLQPASSSLRSTTTATTTAASARRSASSAALAPFGGSGAGSAVRSIFARGRAGWSGSGSKTTLHDMHPGATARWGELVSSLCACCGDSLRCARRAVSPGPRQAREVDGASGSWTTFNTTTAILVWLLWRVTLIGAFALARACCSCLLGLARRGAAAGRAGRWQQRR